MQRLSLDRVVEFNDQLVALELTGLPVDLGIGDSHLSLADRLESITARLASRTGRDSTLDQIIRDDEQIPVLYRHAIDAWSRGEEPHIVFGPLTQRAFIKQQISRAFSPWIVQTIILLVLLCVGIAYLASNADRIQAFYQDTQLAEPISLTILLIADRTAYLWIPIFFVSLCVAFLLWRNHHRKTRMRAIPGQARFSRAMQHANVADRLASLTQHGVSLDEALELVREPEPGVASSSSDKSEESDVGQQLRDSVVSSPPLLRWAIQGDMDVDERAQAFRFAADVYRQKAENIGTVTRFVYPMLIAALVGGALVLGYALLLFSPFVQLLNALA